MNKKLALTFALALGVSTAAQATVITYDFDTDQSGSFAVVEDGGPDSTTDFVFDYSTHAQDAPSTNVAIPSAPNSSGGTTQGVRLAVNLSLIAFNSLTAYPDVSAAAAEFADGEWTLTVDVWANHNGNAGGNSGSTEFWGAGANSDTVTFGAFGAADGFNYLITGDGGSGTDYRYYQGVPAALDSAAGNWWGNGAASVNQSAAEWVTFFPNDGTLGTSPTGSVLAGASGKQWITVTLEVSNSGADRVLSFTRVGDGSPTVVSTVTGATGSTANPLIAYGDAFTSVNSEPTDQFVVFDNLVLDGQGIDASSVNQWDVFE